MLAVALLQAHIIFFMSENGTYVHLCMLCLNIFSYMLLFYYLISSFMVMFVARMPSSSQVSMLLQQNKGLTFSPLNPLQPGTFCRFFT